MKLDDLSIKELEDLIEFKERELDRIDVLSYQLLNNIDDEIEHDTEEKDVCFDEYFGVMDAIIMEELANLADELDKRLDE